MTIRTGVRGSETNDEMTGEVRRGRREHNAQTAADRKRGGHTNRRAAAAADGGVVGNAADATEALPAGHAQPLPTAEYYISAPRKLIYLFINYN